ncbi:MAG: thioredoxin domain-containing protein [Desulfobacterales bacterium]|nr:thioredoxin domain-containing protein [Desulfobacterales bacterium]
MEHEEQKFGEEHQDSESALPNQEKKKKRKIILAGIIVAGVLVGAALSYLLYFGDTSRQSLASVNGEKIIVEEFNTEMAKVEVPYQDMYREEPKQFIDGLIMKKLLLQEAKKQGVSVPAKTYKDTDKDAVSPDDALIAELIKKRFSTPPTVTPQEIQVFYDTFKDRMEGKTLDQVAPTIEKIIREGKQQEEVQQFLGDLHKSAMIDIDEGRIKKMAIKPPDSNTEEEFKKSLQGGKPFLVDFGANSCIPCRQMRPILKEVGKEYSGKAGVLVIDIYKYQNLAREYKVQMIPTLVFFDGKGKEVFRHIGMLEKEKIVAKLKEIGMES